MRTSIIILFSLAISLPSHSQQYEFGDAPEGAVAYPSSGLIGLFPTCITVGPNSYVRHTNFGAILGPSFDFEGDGNAGTCPTFAPYDLDECFQDGDAGLLFPEAYTISGGAVIPCPGYQGSALGAACQLANWGVDVDIDVTNNMPGQTDGYMNVIMDFTQNGVWGDYDNCPSGAIPEHVLVNFLVPWGYSGPLSGLGPPPFTIGNNTGYVWTRFTLSEQPVQQDWDGHAFFEDGESEDYLLEIRPLETSDFGDAPEDVLAYPSTGVIGAFPTCITVGANGYVEHLQYGAYLGASVDLEADGNAGLCPTFAPYDNDECFNDGDAGLLIIDSYTINNGVVTLCPNSSGVALGYPCDTVVWGTDVDIHAENQMVTQMDAYLNVLIDWNRDGDWGDSVYCDTIKVREHVLVNFPIPFGFSGPVSGLVPPDFIIGPHHGFFWSRFTISDMPVYANWDGNGFFEDGESEDYLIHVDTVAPPPPDEFEYGDAPEGPVAYPSLMVMGAFPTCINSGPPNHYIEHRMDELIHFGPMKDYETEGNAGLCSPYTLPYNNDECFMDGDAGLTLPHPYTIIFTGGFHVVVPCVGQGGILDTICHMVHWGPEIDIRVVNLDTIDAVVNVLMDFNQDGAWALDPTTLCAGNVVPEHVLVNFTVPAGYNGQLSSLNPPAFQAGPNAGYIWTRFTIGEKIVVNDWNGVDFFEKGETEDYLLKLDLPEITGEYQMNKLNLNIFPNPTNNSCNISYHLIEGTRVKIDVFDVRGELVRHVIDMHQAYGTYKLTWDGKSESGQSVDNGIYIIKVSLNDYPAAIERILMIK